MSLSPSCWWMEGSWWVRDTEEEGTRVWAFSSVSHNTCQKSSHHRRQTHSAKAEFFVDLMNLQIPWRGKYILALGSKYLAFIYFWETAYGTQINLFNILGGFCCCLFGLFLTIRLQNILITVFLNLLLVEVLLNFYLKVKELRIVVVI